MEEIKKIKLKLKSGILSKLHSDQIFGHFAWRFVEEYGKDKLDEFLNLFLNGEPVFSISDGFLEKNDEIFFPKPMRLTPNVRSGDTKAKKITNFVMQKERKSRQLINLKQLNLFLKNDINNFENSFNEKNVNTPTYITDLRISVEIDRNTNKAKKNQLFSEHPKYICNDTFITIFIKVLNKAYWQKYNCEEILKTIFQVGYGKKKSSGYGHFEVVSIDNFLSFEEPINSNGFISLSHFLPKDSDEILDSFYDYDVKYGKLGEHYSELKNPFKKPMILLKPGSCFFTNNKKSFYGRAINNVNEYMPNIVHNGIAFTLSALL